MVMDIREMCAEKIRAANERARYRDFYDLYMLEAAYRAVHACMDDTSSTRRGLIPGLFIQRFVAYVDLFK